MTLANLVAVSRLTDALSRATTLDDVYEASLDALEHSLGVGRASVLLFDEKGVMSFVAARGISDGYKRAVNGHTPWTSESRNAEPICIADWSEEPSLAKYADVFGSENIRALGFFPLNYRDVVIGKFMLYYAERHEFTNAEVDLARTIAGQIAFGVARIRAEEELERERKRLEDIIANVPGIVWETVATPGANPRTTFISEQIEALFGYEAGAWLADPHLRSAALAARHTIDDRTQHCRIRRPDGRSVWVEVRSSSKDEGGKVVTRGVTMDITARKEQEQRREFLNEASDVLGSSLDYETIDRVVALIAAHLDAWCAIDIADHGEMRRLAAAGGAAPNGEQIEVPLRGGSELVGMLSIAAHAPQRRFTADDRAFITDLGRRIGYAVENALLYREAQDANRAKDEFLATLSHELRTPMTATLGWATMLRHHNLPDDTKGMAVETIERSTRAQAKLIDDILDVSRIVTGKFELNVGTADLPALVRNAIEAIQPSLDQKELQLELSVDSGIEPIQGDPARLQQVMWNLVSNAVKFTGRGGSISVALEKPDEAALRVTVTDTGAGIPAAFLPYVFERFRQIDSSTTRSHGGLGLGLAIVKSIVEMHGGSVAVQSAGEGKGATFTIVLPNRAPEMETRAAERTQHAQALDGVTVLLVEDDADTREMLSLTLRHHGANVHAAPSVPVALQIAREVTPHVVLSDIGMPGDDGYSLMMKIRSGAIEQLRDVPAIALTAYAREDDRQRALSSGFGYHLAKPVDPMLVVQTIAEAARGERPSRPQ